MATQPQDPPGPPRRAIRTNYHGQQFRSKLEAKWALVLDELQVVWDYEPEARLTAHGGYLPDFYLPRVGDGLWLEIKPYDAHGKAEDPRWLDFARERQQNLVVAFGLPDPYGEDLYLPRQPGVCLKCFGKQAEVDYDYLLTCCAVCGTVGFEFEGRGARVCRSRVSCYGRPDADRGHNADDGRIIQALIAARAAFCGEVPSADLQRTLPDTAIERLAQALKKHNGGRGGITKWLDAQALSPGDRQAVLRAWGRLPD